MVDTLLDNALCDVCHDAKPTEGYVNPENGDYLLVCAECNEDLKKEVSNA